MVDVLFEHARGHRSGDRVPRQQLVDEPFAFGVAQQRTVTAERLREQRPRHRRMVQRRRMELDELDVGDRDTGRAAPSPGRRLSTREGSW